MLLVAHEGHSPQPGVDSVLSVLRLWGLSNMWEVQLGISASMKLNFRHRFLQEAVKQRARYLKLNILTDF